jgi:alkyl hydroperoxide reductase subunit AhpC
VARLKPEFDKRSVKTLGLSIDPVDSHKGWAADIKETQGHAPNFPIVADPDRTVAGHYDEEARAKFPNGWRALKPYLRLTPQPR